MCVVIWEARTLQNHWHVHVGHAGDTPVFVSSMRWEENICLFKKISSNFKYCLQILIVIYFEYLK